jgi:tRNA pseudouridine55 synthase
MSNENKLFPHSSLITHYSSLSISGVLNLDKPAGPTSHDVVARVRRLLNPKSGIQNPKLKVGHAGTLDPAATGVLVVLLGTATRLAEYLTDLLKEYEARIRFGLCTDTQDTTGVVLSQQDASSVTEAQLRAALAGFRGEIRQTPPMVSAVKVGGQRLYELARRGEEVERAARPVTIYELRLEEFHAGPEAWGQLFVRCSSGTYVRTLCADLGEALGCGAAMAELRRTAIGPFRLSDAVSLEELEQAVANGRLTDYLLPPTAAVAHLPAVTIDAADQARLVHGMAISGQPGTREAGDAICDQRSAISGQRSAIRVLGETGALIAIARLEPSTKDQENRPMLVPDKVLLTPVGAES